ncbi:MAG TPA: glycosyltransferase [Thermoanaerobaculia bacterium]|nr:glycosyltransferase [Thermoanaerobaculia bacterium]
MPRRDLILVTAGLGLDGGGRAVVGRLLATAGAKWAAGRGVGFSVLALTDDQPLLEPLRWCGFGGSRARLSAAVWAAQTRPGQRPALVFDLLGLARTQALLPAFFAGPHALFLLGIEVWRPLSWLHRRALLRARRVLAISRFTLERAAPFLPPTLRPAEVLPLALEQRAPTAEPDAALLASLGRGFVLSVGRMSASERYKGHDELLEAWGRLGETRPDARLVVAGGGDDRPRLEARAAELGLGGRVRFTGFIDEATLAELYRRAGVFTMVSTGEGFGLVYLEAMRAGVPCVAARGSAAAEIIEPGTTGLLVPAGSPAELAGALDRLLGDPATAARMGEAGRRHHAAELSLARFEARLGTVLDELTEVRRVRD